MLEAVADLALPQDRQDSLGLAVSEAITNAMEHGNGYGSDEPVIVRVTADRDRLRVAITDVGDGTNDVGSAEEPDIEAKLRGEQPARGWGLFLIRSLVDEVHETGDEAHHTLTLTLRLAASDGAA